MDFDSLPDDNKSAAPADEQDTTKSPQSFDSLKEDAAPDFDSLQDDQEKYGTGEQQLKTAAEGVAQGVAGPLATYAETHLLGVKPEDIVGRQEANPYIHGISEAAGVGGSLLTGVGEAGLAAKAASRLTPVAASVMGKVGAAALKAGITTALTQGGDELSRHMLGQGDPEHPVSSALAHIGAAGLLGSVTGGLFNIAGQGGSKALQALENNKMGDKAQSFLRGMGVASSQATPDLEEAVKTMDGHSEAAYQAGKKFFNVGLQSGVQKAVDQALEIGGAGAIGEKFGGAAGVAAYAAIHQALGPYIEKIVGKTLTPAIRAVASPVIGKALTLGETKGLFNLLNYANSAVKGSKAIQKGIDGLFSSTLAGGQQAVDAYASDRDREKIKEFVENGGVNQQVQNQLQESTPQPSNFAKGGMVPEDAELEEPDHFGAVLPEQNQLLNTAKGRIYNYLNGVRPQKPMGLPFDTSPAQPEQQRKYEKAVEIAAAPLSILNHVKQGSLTPEHLQHFVGMFPEMHRHLSKKISEKMAEEQLEGRRPSYRVRQSLSMFLGAPVDSTFTPQSLQLIQSVSQSPQQQPPQQGPAPKSRGKSGSSSKAALSKVAADARTPSQARAAREDKI